MASATKNSKMVKLTEFQLQYVPFLRYLTFIILDASRAFKDNFPIAANSSDVVFQRDLTPHQLKLVSRILPLTHPELCRVVKQKDRNKKARLRMAK
jgi:hypothetical protein